MVLLHSCNCLLWGANGISVDGITIPDPASLYPDQIARAGPGARLPETTNPVMVLEGGRPSLAASTIGVGLQQVALQNLIYILDFGMDAQKAVDQPNFQGGWFASALRAWTQWIRVRKRWTPPFP